MILLFRKVGIGHFFQINGDNTKNVSVGEVQCMLVEVHHIFGESSMEALPRDGSYKGMQLHCPLVVVMHKR